MERDFLIAIGNRTSHLTGTCTIHEIWMDNVLVKNDCIPKRHVCSGLSRIKILRNRRGRVKGTKLPVAKWVSYGYEVYSVENIVNNYVIFLYGDIS